MASDRAECSSCRQFCRIFYKGVSQKQVLQSLQKDADKRAKHIEAVAKYEQNYEAKGGMNKGVAQHVEAPSIEVSVESAAVVKSELDLGVFWPMDIYNSHPSTTTPLTKGECIKHSHNGRSYLGILRDSSLGCPRGCMRLTDADEVSVKKKQMVQDDAGPCSSNDVAQTFEKVRASLTMAIGAKKAKDSEGKEIDVLFVKKVKSVETWGGSDDEDCDDWVNVVNKQLAVGTGKATRDKKRSRSATSSQSGGKSQATAKSERTSKLKSLKPRREPPSSCKKAKGPQAVYPSEQQRALNSASSHRMEANAMLDLAGNSDGFATLSRAKVAKLASKLDAKLEPTSQRVLAYRGAKGNEEAHSKLAEQGEDRGTPETLMEPQMLANCVAFFFGLGEVAF